MTTSVKSVWKSKTFWVNFAVLLVILLESIIANESSLLEAFGAESVAIIIAVANIGLRLVTNTGVTFKKTDG